MTRTSEDSESTQPPSLERATLTYEEHPERGPASEVETLLVAAEDLRHSCHAMFTAAPDAADSAITLPGWDLAASRFMQDRAELMIRSGRTVASLDVNRGRALVKVHAKAPDSARDALHMIRDILGAPNPEAYETRVLF